MGTYDIELPAKQRIAFPALCVVCETPNPDGQIELSILGANTGSVTMAVADELLDTGAGSTYSSNTSNRIDGIPACKKCSGRLKWYHRILKFATYTAWIPGILIMLAMPGPIWIRVIVFLAFVISPAILSMIFPPAFGATFLNGKANFEFRSKQIADAFRNVNGLVTPVETHE